MLKMHHDMHEMEMMKNYFHFGINDVILFKKWKPTTTGEFVGACVVIILAGVVHEALRYGRVRLAHYSRCLCAVAITTTATPKDDSDHMREDSTSPLTPGATAPAAGCCDRSADDSTGGKTSTFPYVTFAPTGLGSYAPFDGFGQTRKWRPYPCYIALGQTLLYALHTTLSFGLMLIFMTFNVYLCGAVIMGLTLGYFIFVEFLPGRISVGSDVRTTLQTLDQPCCH